MSSRIRLFALALMLPAAAPAQDFTVMTHNMWYSGAQGFDVITHRMPLGFLATLPGMAQFYRRIMPSGYGIIGLQEVDKRTRRAFGWNVPQYVDNRMGSGWTHRYGGNMHTQGGTMGNAVVTNVSITKTQYWRLPWNPYNKSHFGKQRRGAVAVKLHFGGDKRLWFVNTHLEPFNPHALRQVGELMTRIKQLHSGTPVILCGDLNIQNRPTGIAEPEYYLMRQFLNLSGFRDVSPNLRTIVAAPYLRFRGQIDYIWLYDPHDRLEVTRCVARTAYGGRFIFSDHRAVIANFRWK